MALFELQADALGAVEQPSQMEASQRIVGMQSDQSGKGRHRSRVTGLQLGEGLGILRCRRPLKCCFRQRLVGPERLAAPAAHEIADRPSLETLGASGYGGADANARAEE